MHILPGQKYKLLKYTKRSVGMHWTATVKYLIANDYGKYGGQWEFRNPENGFTTFFFPNEVEPFDGGNEGF